MFMYKTNLLCTLQPQRKLFGSLTEEAEVKVPASKAWALYGTLDLGKLIVGKLLEAVLNSPLSPRQIMGAIKIMSQLDLEKNVTKMDSFYSLTAYLLRTRLGFPNYKEKFTKVDNENMIKETEVVEGGFLDIGFTLYRIRFEIKENPNDATGSSCIQKLTIEYEVKEEFAANATLITNEPLLNLISVASEHLLKSN
ncbi:norbelladine synthase-like [Bidens hawaiensis]|uniref:norbelladine synthase-like n=1 Tax=Bidens hawaiensis TaxID=980011 RepID=UPI004049D0D5